MLNVLAPVCEKLLPVVTDPLVPAVNITLLEPFVDNVNVPPVEDNVNPPVLLLVTVFAVDPLVALMFNVPLVEEIVVVALAPVADNVKLVPLVVMVLPTVIIPLDGFNVIPKVVSLFISKLPPLDVIFCPVGMIIPPLAVIAFVTVNVLDMLVAPFNDTLPVPVLNVKFPVCEKLLEMFNAPFVTKLPPMYKFPPIPTPPVTFNAPLVVLVLLVDEFINISPLVTNE